MGGILLEPLQWHQLLTPKGWKRLTTEGHTFADAILTVAMAQIGIKFSRRLCAANAEQSCHAHTTYAIKLFTPSLSGVLLQNGVQPCLYCHFCCYSLACSLHDACFACWPPNVKVGLSLGSTVTWETKLITQPDKAPAYARHSLLMCRPSDACVAPSDVPNRHHSWCHPHGGFWLVQHLEHVDSGHLLHGAEK